MQGQEIGRTIDLTANLQLEENYKSSWTVSLVQSTIETACFGMMNIGFRPTLARDERSFDPF